MQTTHLEDLVNPAQAEAVLAEVRHLLGPMGAWDPLIARAHGDTVRLFRGEYPGYRRSNTKYHDLEHTMSVFLAMARLLHGAWCEGLRLEPPMIRTGMFAALFHDVGLIQHSDDTSGTGAKYTVGHEDRSNSFMSDYLGDCGVPPEEIADGKDMIAGTRLMQRVSDIAFRTPECALVGKMVASADLLAQMGDRAYLEKLLLLFREFEEARLPGFDSELTLLEKTEDFYEHVVRKRLEEDLDNVARYLPSHFKARWEIERDLYALALTKNLEYLRKVLEEDRDNYRERLRRAGVVARLESEEFPTDLKQSSTG